MAVVSEYHTLWRSRKELKHWRIAGSGGLLEAVKNALLFASLTDLISAILNKCPEAIRKRYVERFYDQDDIEIFCRTKVEARVDHQ